jgi:hypothetical protein
VSTLKTDAVTAVSTNSDLSLDGLGTGGVSIASTLKMAKGGDIASASPLVIDTDGNYFDVTGTTNFSAMTVESGNFFMLQFDSALTITHGSGIELPGAANLTTATGDRLMCYATAANTVEVMSVETEAAASAGFTQGTEVATTSGAGSTFSSIPAGTKVIYIMFMGVVSNGDFNVRVQIGDAGGIETSGYLGDMSNLASAVAATQGGVTGFWGINKYNAADILHGTMVLTLADTSNTWTQTHNLANSNANTTYFGGGAKPLSAELTQLSFSLDSGAFTAGSINIMYQ